MRNHSISVLGVIVTALTVVMLGVLAQADPFAFNGPGYVALGDSIEFGLGDDNPADGFGYVDPFGAFLSSVLAAPVAVTNLGTPGATTQDIWLAQRRPALAALVPHSPSAVVVSWGGGGVDLGEVALSAQAAACMRQMSCLGRFNGLLNAVEHTIDRTIAQIRHAAGSQALILMRTQYNAVARSGCAAAETVQLGNATLEGAPGTVLDRGLNDRIRTVADRYGAQVVDLFLPFAVSPDTLVSVDCVHPSGIGYQVILTLMQAAYLGVS